VLGLVVCGSAVPACAGAWSLPKDTGQVINTVTFDTARRAFDDQGKLVLDVDFSKTDMSLFWEHGLTDKWTVVLNSNYQTLSFQDAGQVVSFTGLGDTSLSMRRVIYRHQNTIVSAQAGVVFSVPGETVSDADLGLGDTNIEGRVLAGHSFKMAGKDGFIELQTAWRIRPSGVPDEWSVDSTIGWRPQKKILLLAQGLYANGEQASGIARKNIRFKLQPSVVYDFSAKTSFQIGAFQTVAGKNIIREKAVFISIWRRY
jgi:hypothetical protein